jgi:hypothetical protein
MPPYCEVDMPPYCEVDKPPPCDVLRLRGQVLMFGITGLLTVAFHALCAQCSLRMTSTIAFVQTNVSRACFINRFGLKLVTSA